MLYYFFIQHNLAYHPTRTANAPSLGAPPPHHNLASAC